MNIQYSLYPLLITHRVDAISLSTKQPPASQQTLGELASNFELYGLCTACKRMPQLNIAQLVKVFGRDTTVDTIRRKLVCNRCGRRTRNIRVVYRGPQGGAAAFKYLDSH